MSNKAISKKATPTLTTSDLLAMYRCALFTAMGVTNEETKPTDRQCIQWLSLVTAQAAHVTDPPITLVPSQPIPAALNSGIPVMILRWDAKVELPTWRGLPK